MASFQLNKGELDIYCRYISQRCYPVIPFFINFVKHYIHILQIIVIDSYALFEYLIDFINADFYLRFQVFCPFLNKPYHCLLYTSDAADERSSVDLGGRRIIKKKTNIS